MHTYAPRVFLCLTGDRGHCRNAGEERPLLGQTVEAAARRVLRRPCANGWLIAGRDLKRHQAGSSLLFRVVLELRAAIHQPKEGIA